ncbi:MAG: lipopolysaccharide biosynthesis protein [Desulfobacterales bacterium]|nr:lipopolysaccharide biosynthesis protein [Desulfobacterales bacterium]
MNTFTPAASSGLKLRANFSWTFVGNVINAGCWFSMAIVLVKLGSPEHLGQFALGLATTAPIFMFASLRLRDVQATDAKEEYLFGDFFALRLSTTALALLVVVGIASLSGFQRAMALVILATGCSKAIENISDAFYGLFMRHERLDRVAKSLMIKGPLSLLGLGIGFYLTGSVFWGVIGLTMARTTILLSYDLRNAILTLNPSSKRISNIMPKEWPRPRWNAKILARLVWLALPLGFVTMLISFTSNIPRYFIEGYLGSYQLGIFAAIASFQKVAPTVVQALGRSASPRLAKYYSAYDARAFRQLMSKMIGIGVLLGGAGVLVALVLGRQILTLFYGPAYALPGLFGLLMLAAGIDYIATMLLFGITSARYFKIQLPLQLITTGAVALACYRLIPSAGLTGAAMALIIGNLCRAGCGLVVAWHVQRSLNSQSIAPEAQISTSRV